MGRPRKTLPPNVEGRDVYELLVEWPEAGVELEDCAARSSMSPNTMREILGRPRRDGTPTVEPRDKRASDCWQIGHGRRKTWLWSQLHDSKVTNKSPAIYELKSKYLYSDMPRQEPLIDNRQIQVALPGPLRLEDYRRLVAEMKPEVLPEAKVVS